MNETDPMTCTYCGGKSVVLDHVTPRILGGLHHPLNLTPSCNACNSSKGGTLLAEWLIRHFFGRRDHNPRRAAVRRRYLSGELQAALPVPHAEMLAQGMIEAAWEMIQGPLAEAHGHLCDAHDLLGVDWLRRAGDYIAGGASEDGDEEE